MKLTRKAKEALGVTKPPLSKYEAKRRPQADPLSPFAGLASLKPVRCVNAHDRCYEGGPCPLCEPRA